MHLHRKRKQSCQVKIYIQLALCITLTYCIAYRTMALALPMYFCIYETDDIKTDVKNTRDSKHFPVAVFHKDMVMWRSRGDLCESTELFPKIILQTSVGNRTIFLYSENEAYYRKVIATRGVYEKGLVEKVIKILQMNRDLQFIDIGALVGQYTIIAAMLRRKVVAVDPLLDSIRRMCQSVLANGFEEQVTLVYNALSNTETNSVLHFTSRNFGETRVLPMSEAKGAYPVCVKTTTLDDLLPFVYKLKPVMIKMDVEYSEANVIRGAETFFNSRDVQFVIMEWIHVKEDPKNVDVIFEFMSRHQMFPIDGDGPMFKKLDYSQYMKWSMNIIWTKDHHFA